MTRTLHLELRPDQGDVWSLRSWWDHPNETATRRLALPEIDDLLDLTRLYYDGAFGADLDRVGRRLHDWLDGGERWLAGAIEAARFDVDVMVLAIDVAGRMAALPWETMNDGRSLLVRSVNPRIAIARWRPARGGVREPENRPLQVLFMASSPEGVAPELDFEEEEARILKAGAHAEAEVTVEESGSLPSLRQLVNDHPEGFFDVFHLTGHASRGAEGPRFLLENETGDVAPASAAEIAGALPRRPRLAFLSGCRTAQGDTTRDVRSMAEEVMGQGIRSVLGWGQPVFDVSATRAAELLYGSLSAGADLATAVTETVGKLAEEGVSHWHLFRWFQAGDPPSAYVTPLNHPGRRSPERPLAEQEFLDGKSPETRVANRSEFVGHRRLLQRSVRELRSPVAPAVGIHLSGFMGRGKSSVAARLCDRLARDYDRVVVFGALDETKLLQALFEPLSDQGHQELRGYVFNRNYDLAARLRKLLRSLRERGDQARLFVLDDFERNQPDLAQGSDRLEAESAAPVLGALIDAVRATGRDRILVTGRYALPEPYASALPERRVEPLSEGGQLKLLRRLQAAKPGAERVSGDRLRAVRDVAEGNPRLFRLLVSVALEEDVDFDGLIRRLHEAEDEFRVQSAAAELVGNLRESARDLLAAMPMFVAPVPLAALIALEADSPRATEEDVARACAFALLDPYRVGEGPPSFLASSLVTGLLPAPDAETRRAQARRVSPALWQAWRPDEAGVDEAQAFTLALVDGFAEDLSGVKAVVGHWASRHRHPLTLDLYGRIPAIFEGDARLLHWLAEAYGHLGMGEAADAALERAKAIPIADARDRALSRGREADRLFRRGDLDGALRIRREEELPVYERLGDVRSVAVTQGKVADVLYQRGDLDGALRIRQEECLPVYERLGDVRSVAVAQGQVADVLYQRGDLEGALRIRREEELPVYERLGDAQSLIVLRVEIAQTLVARGDVERDGEEIVESLVWAYREARARGLSEAGPIADLMRQLGISDARIDGL